jgi:hypothetical protein
MKRLVDVLLSTYVIAVVLIYVFIKWIIKL